MRSVLLLLLALVGGSCDGFAPQCDLLAACVDPTTCASIMEVPDGDVPRVFDVVFETTAGNFTVRVTTSWAPPFANGHPITS